MNEERKQLFFAELAPTYNILTGNATQDIFAKFLDNYGSSLNITGSSVIHDNASGPGTAAQVLLKWASASTGNDGDNIPTILATDFNKGMIDALQTLQTSKLSKKDKEAASWDKVTSQVLDSTDLSSIQDNSITHSIMNFSLFTIANPIRALREVYRTLKPGGTAIITVWKRFAIEPLLATAQDHIKGDGWAAEHALPTNGPQYAQKDMVGNQLVEAGFEKGEIETWAVEHFVSSEMREEWEGLVRFMSGTSIAKGTTRGWSGEEIEMWEGAVRWAMDRDVEREGGKGLRFEGWVNVVRK